MATDGLSIGRAAQQLGVSARTLRYYEELGLLEGARRGAGEYRTYDGAALARARQILVLARAEALAALGEHNRGVELVEEWMREHDR